MTRATSVPVHIANVDAALKAAPFEDALPKRKGAPAKTTDPFARVREMRSAFVASAFNAAAGDEPPLETVDLSRGGAHYTMHTRLLCGDTEREHVDCIALPRGSGPRELLCKQVRLLANNGSLWGGEDKVLASVPGLLGLICRDAAAFAAGWRAVSTEDGESLSREFKTPGGTVTISASELPVLHAAEDHDEESLQLVRAAASISHALAALGHPPRGAVLHVETPQGRATVEVGTLLTVPEGKFVHDVDSSVYVGGAPARQESGSTALLAVACSGIQHDAIFERGGEAAKSIIVLQGASPMHPAFGLHDTAAVQLTMPQILRTAHWVGEVHFMTQIGKTILKSRPEKDSEVLKLTVEQRGVHLKDEVKLCAYWEAISGALEPKERRCLDLAVQRMHEKRPIAYEALGGAISSQGSPALVGAKASGLPPKSLHHVEARVRIKGAMSFPCAMLQRGPRSLNVRIDNVWLLESHLLAVK